MASVIRVRLLRGSPPNATQRATCPLILAATAIPRQAPAGGLGSAWGYLLVGFLAKVLGKSST